MEVYSIGFTKRSAADFFGTLKRVGVHRLIDVRLHNASQLAGFTKRDDLGYFLRVICDADYHHEPLLAPTPALFDAYKKSGSSWATYAAGFNTLLRERHVEDTVPRELFTTRTVLLCHEPTAEHCHRRLVLEYLARVWGDLAIQHL